MTSDTRNDLYLREDVAAMWQGRDPFQAAQAQTGKIFRDKEGRRTLRFEHDGRAYFLKLHQGVGWKEIFKNLAQGRSPVLGAENEYRAIRAFETLGIDTLSIAAYGKQGANPATQLSFLITDELDNVETLEDICGRWPQHPPTFTFKKQLIERVANVARLMHGSGINHRDFYLCHFLLEGDGAAAIERRKLFLMDLHRAQIRHRVPQRWQIKDIGGLYYSALDIGLNKRDIFRFMRAYTQRSLRDLLNNEQEFWLAVRARARRIYVRDHRREPQSAAWHLQRSALDAFLQGERNLITPTQLSLRIDGQIQSLRIDSVLRLLPRKRLVVKGTLDNQTVVAKLFVRSSSSQRHVVREHAGHAALMKCGVQHPQLLGTFTTQCERFEGVLYEFIDAMPLSAHWPALDTNTRQLWLQKIVQTMLSLHQQGVYQSDIHADNFLLKQDALYLLDLGSVVCTTAPLTRKQSIANLGALIAQFSLGERQLFSKAIAAYLAERQWPDDPPFQHELSDAITHSWQLRKHDYLDKALRECKLTAFKQSFSQRQAIRRTWLGEAMTQLCANPDRFMQSGKLLKAGNTATVVKAELNGKPIIIKRYNIKNWRHAISRALRPTRAEHSWLYAHWLELAGIESMKPIALIEKRFGWLRSTAYFVGSWIEGDDLLATGQHRQLTDKEINHVKTLLEIMRDTHLSHGDFKANNLILTGSGVALIDLDAMREHTNERKWQSAFARDMARLLRNWPDSNHVRQQINAMLHQVLP
ncbi:MAG: lipopolysaccharide core heptose(I) kinase RfaP [Spongiibacteraceae bacterium]